jgi:hypothetical protein
VRGRKSSIANREPHVALLARDAALISKETSMHTEPGLPKDDDHCCDTKLNFSAAKLEVYRHERLANTEPPRKISSPPKNSSRRAALLKVMAAWAQAHF